MIRQQVKLRGGPPGPQSAHEPAQVSAAADEAATPPVSPPPTGAEETEPGSADPQRPVIDLTAVGPLPVLEAFQEFLDAERRNTRHRITVLSLGFAGAILAVLLACGIIGAAVNAGTRDSLRALGEELEGYRAVAEKTKSASRISQSRFQKETEELRSELARQNKTSAAQRKDTGRKLGIYRKEILSLRRSAKKLKRENSVLKKDVATMRKKVFKGTASVTVPPEPTARDHTTDTSLRMTIKAGKGTDPFPWSIPIPE